VPRRCAFCEKAGDAWSLTELRDGDDVLTGYSCQGCEKRYAAFEARLTHLDSPGPAPAPWLASDVGTAHVVLATPGPFNAVHTVIDGLRSRIQDVPRATARIAAARLGVQRSPEAIRCESREEAIAVVSALIAEELADHYESIKRFNEGRDWLVHSVSLFGEGHGVLLSRMAANGERLGQRCFLIEFDHSVHDFVSCRPGGSQQFITLP
jgi:hypothetical protein